ncbi:transcription factor with AP2 domain-containing protein [Babesia ovata]|uniref:Transcription factor with AP2 domain-containing protein n=1 Tax=Babesia ovata TaxID=189622 RepID=A0A2H6K6P4_9APIC|nr:transcription factor with AP2 domain-containing protein [Babesia ovata]GBE58648.1 transcription factor with AP2 domain-containing protein [Babesia ovata]
MVRGGDSYGYSGDVQDISSSGEKTNRMERLEQPDSVDYGLPETSSQQLYDNGGAGYQPSDGGYADQGWNGPGYMGLTQEGLHFSGEVPHESHMAFGNQGFDMSSTLVGSFGSVVSENSMQSAEGSLHSKMLDMSHHDVMPPHGMSLKMDGGSMPGDPPRRALSKGRKNKDEANELVRRAKLLPKVMGVRYDANHQYWVATWYQNRKRMDRYFSVGRFGFEEARMLAIDCRKTADAEVGEKNTEYYGGSDSSKKTKDFNRLNVSKVALNYILSDLCNNCLPSILENNHMPGELYIHCYNKISDHLQMIITANHSEEIEKYLHLFQLCIQNRVLPSALQVQEQRAMITTLCQM